MLKRLYQSKGFSLIEMAIVLLIAGLLVGGAFQLINNMQQQRTDQATANEMRQIINAMQQFLLDQSGIISTITAPVNMSIAGNSVGLGNNSPQFNPGTGNTPVLTYFENNYLNVPSSEPTTSPLRLVQRGYRIGIRNIGPIGGRTVYKAVILRTPTSDINESRLARIAALVGSQGGLVRTAGAGVEVSGIQGSWSIVPAEYALTGGRAPVAGQLAAFTTTIDNQMNTNVISRINTGNPEANTMRSDLILADDSLARNALGVSFVKTDALKGSRCDAAGTTFNLQQPDGTAFSPPRNFNLSASVNGVQNATRIQNSVLLGRDSSGAQTLLQCRRNTSGQWAWESAIPNNFGSTIALYKYQSYPGGATVDTGNRTNNVVYVNDSGGLRFLHIVVRGGDCRDAIIINSNPGATLASPGWVALIAFTADRAWNSFNNPATPAIPAGYAYAYIRNFNWSSGCGFQQWIEVDQPQS